MPLGGIIVECIPCIMAFAQSFSVHCDSPLTAYTCATTYVCS
uniref:Uncharacterized protein n=1 Tax=Rhizophora mucronata TaxID=61149 RepID=A0A2P2QHE9_RHIMU